MARFAVVRGPDGRSEIIQLADRPSLDPEIGRRAADAGLRSDHPVLVFVSDRCVVGGESAVPASELYGSFRRWALGRGQEPLTQAMFGRILSRLSIPPTKSGLRGRIARRGVRLR